MISLLKYAGVKTISMSLESGNDRIRNDLLKRHMSKEQFLKAHQLCQKYDVTTFTNCIIGLPTSRLPNDLESLDLCVKAKVDWVEFVIFYPFPRTILGDMCERMGLYKPDYKNMHTSYMYGSLLSCFSAVEKNIYRNVSSLGAIAVLFPWLRSLVVKHLIYWPHNKLFTIAFYLLKMWVIRNKIYETKTSLRELFRHESSDKL